MDYLLVLRPPEPLETLPRVPGTAKVESHPADEPRSGAPAPDAAPIARIELSFGAMEPAERFDEEVRAWLEVAERGGMAVFDPQLGRQVSRADLGEILDRRARSLSYAVGVLGDTGVAAVDPARRGLPGWALAAVAIALAVVALRFC